MKVADVLQDEQTQLMPVPRPFDGYVELLARVSSTSLIHLERNRYSVPTEHANSVVSLRIYHDHIAAVADGVRVAAHRRCFDRSQTLYDWQHYISQLDAPPDPADKGVLRAPVKLEGFALPELERNESALGCGQPFLDLPQPGKCADAAIAAGVAQLA